MIDGGRLLVRENLAEAHLLPLQNADFQSIVAHNASAVTLSEKVQLTRIVSPLRAFQ